MYYKIEFEEYDKDDKKWIKMTQKITAENDNEAIRQYDEFKQQLAVNSNFRVTGLVMTETKEVLTRILPRNSL